VTDLQRSVASTLHAVHHGQDLQGLGPDLGSLRRQFERFVGE
jgi:hypothetical protein